MSIVHASERGWYISHKMYIDNSFTNVSPTECVKCNSDLFNITSPYKPSINREKSFGKHKDKVQNEHELLQNDIAWVRDGLEKFLPEIARYFEKQCEDDIPKNKNNSALEASRKIYKTTDQFLLKDASGLNLGPAALKVLNNTRFLFPENSKFYCNDVANFGKHVKGVVDLVLLDPPWWNKYIRRKRKATNEAYNMMYNNDVKNIPLEAILGDDSLVAVWCTNSQQHLKSILEDFFPKWGVEYCSKWYWVKVTQKGETICDFSPPPGKQPFEQIIFGCKKGRKYKIPSDKKLIVSVPSALHSHKPPLCEVLKSYLPESPNCLEVFARYLLPNWTSYGNEALKFQHESFFTFVQNKIEVKI